MSAKPLVSCLMLTMPGREKWRELALECFDAQTYPNRELLIVNGPKRIGEKRNIGCGQAEGEIICHWDDDDWSAPTRIADQVQRLQASGADITGYHRMLFLSPEGERWMYEGKPGYAIGTSLCYWKRVWDAKPFPHLQVGEDNAFQKGLRVVTTDAAHHLIATKHDGNTSPRQIESKNWVRQ